MGKGSCGVSAAALAPRVFLWLRCGAGAKRAPQGQATVC